MLDFENNSYCAHYYKEYARSSQKQISSLVAEQKILHEGTDLLMTRIC